MLTMNTMNDLDQLRSQITFPPHASAKYVWEELMKRGWKVRVLRSEAEKLYVLTTVEKNGQKFIISELQHQLYTPLNDRQSYFLTANKSHTQSVLEEVGLSYPKNIFTVDSGTIGQLEGYTVTNKVVVKPHASHGGQGVGIITRTEDLRPAVEYALTYSQFAIVQEFATGEEHRLLMIDGKLAAAFRCRPASVRGDGVSTVLQLIEKKNEAKTSTEYQGTRSKIRISRAVSFMGEKGLDWVPLPDELVILDTISNISFGGDAIDATEKVSSKLIDKVSNLCKMTSLGVVGVDVISPDISSDDISTHLITEINGCPGLRPHILIEEGVSINVAIPYVDALEKYIQIRYNTELEGTSLK